MGSFKKQPVKDFIGKGLSFPIVLSGGKAPITAGADLIKASIKNILAFQIGTRFFLGEFGSRIEDLIEEPNLNLLENVLETFIRDALALWEKRISVEQVEVTPNGLTGINVTIHYILVDSQQPDNLIWPFYKEITQ